MLRRALIVVPIDFSAEMETTVACAVGIAKQQKADVHLLEVAPPHTPSRLDLEGGTAWFDGENHQADWSRLLGLRRSAERDGVRVRTATFMGKATKVIAAYAQLNMATLIVIGRDYGISWFWRNAAVARSLGRSGPVSLLVVPPRMPGSETRVGAPFVEVVSAVGFTVASAFALRTALDLTRGRDARVTALHVLENVPRTMTFSGGEAFRAISDLRAQAAQAAQRLRRRIPAAAATRVEFRVATGAPHRSIIDVASEVNADLIVMGVPPRTRFDEAVFGSTLQKVLRRAKSPVLVLPVVAGAHEWLENTDGVGVVMPDDEFGSWSAIAA